MSKIKNISKFSLSWQIIVCLFSFPLFHGRYAFIFLKNMNIFPSVYGIILPKECLSVATKGLLAPVKLYGQTRVELRLQEADINFFFSDVSEFAEAQHVTWSVNQWLGDIPSSPFLSSTWTSVSKTEEGHYLWMGCRQVGPHIGDRIFIRHTCSLSSVWLDLIMKYSNYEILAKSTCQRNHM